jgi:hypothetical protein
MAALRIAFVGVYTPEDEEFREQAGSLDNKTSWSGNYHGDKTLAALRIIAFAKANSIKTITELDKPIGKIMRRLPDILREYELDRQSRLRKALEDKRSAAEPEAPSA